MPSGQDIKLQPLRVAPGWTINWNTFYEVDPVEGVEHFFEGSSLLQVDSPRLRKIIDVDWRPERDVKGSYHLRVLCYLEHFNEKNGAYDQDVDWEKPYAVFSTASRLELVQKLEALFVSLPPTADDRVLIRRGVLDKPAESLRLKLLASGPTPDLITDILRIGNPQLQRLLSEHEAIDRKTLELLSVQGANKGVRNKAKQKLKQKAFRS